MSFRLQILRRAQRELASLKSPDYERVKDAIRGLGAEPFPRGSKKLTGRQGWRIRVGPYRVVYEIDHQKQALTVLHIGLRRDVYRHL
jgi:mRNA interferase RelE/StbE